MIAKNLLLSSSAFLLTMACTKTPVIQETTHRQQTGSTTTTSGIDDDAISGAAAGLLLNDVEAEDSVIGSEMSSEDVKAACQKRREELMDKYDTNDDGQLSEEERAALMAAMKASFLEKFDTNGDGVVDKAEVEAVRAAIKTKIEEFRKKHQEEFAAKRAEICEKIQARVKAHSDSMNSEHEKSGMADNGLLDRIKLRCEDGDIAADPAKDNANLPEMDHEQHRKEICDAARAKADALGEEAASRPMLQEMLQRCEVQP